MIRVIRETHEAPVELEERVARAGGWNRFGEPNFRVVWGWSRLEWVGGKWTDRDANGNVIRESVELRRVPKYFPHERWHVERWMPPETYGSRKSWWESTIEREGGILVPALGPYPSRGEYEHCFTLSGAKGEFVQLDAAACETIVRAVEWARRQGSRTGRRALARREEASERAWDRRADDVLDDAVPAFHGQVFV